MNDLNEKILQWAEDKGILANGTPESQLAKTFEEVIETAQAVALYGCKEPFYRMSQPCHLEPVKDGIGDVWVTLAIHAKMNGFENIGIAGIEDLEMPNKAAFEQLGKCIVGLATFAAWDTYAYANGILNQLAANHGLTLRECVEHSYQVIAKRNGTMIDGVFVKSN